MQRTLILLIIWLGSLSANMQGPFPDLSKPEDLAKLGKGRIIEKDNSILKQIDLKEIKEYWIVYVKNESLHDKPMEYIKHLEFPNSKWGPLKIEFKKNKPEVSYLDY